MEQIAITHGFMKKLAKNIRSKYGRDVCHTEVLELVADALGWKAGPLMHALKQAEAEKPKGSAISSHNTAEPYPGLIPPGNGSEFALNALSSECSSVLSAFIDDQMAGKKFRAAGLVPANKILLSGSLKGEVAGFISGSLGLPLFQVTCGELLSQGQASAFERIRSAFDYAVGRRCVLFIDDLDVVGMDRDAFRPTNEMMDRIASTLRVLLDVVPSNVILIGGTNQLKLLDRAFLRRFQVRLNLLQSKPSVSHVLLRLLDRLLPECEALTEFQRRHVALMEKDETGERVLLVIENYDRHPDVSAARLHLQRKGLSWSRVEFCSEEELAAVYESAVRAGGAE